MSATCRTCRYWQADILTVDDNAPEQGPMFGECVLISRGLEASNALIRTRALDTGGLFAREQAVIEATTYLETDAAFGCVQHQERPTYPTTEATQ